MKKLAFISALFLSSCISSIYGREILQDDCATEKLKVLVRVSTVSPELYDRIADNCKSVYSGRP